MLSSVDKTCNYFSPALFLHFNFIIQLYMEKSISFRWRLILLIQVFKTQALMNIYSNWFNQFEYILYPFFSFLHIYFFQYHPLQQNLFSKATTICIAPILKPPKNAKYVVNANSPTLCQCTINLHALLCPAEVPCFYFNFCLLNYTHFLCY